MQLHLAFSPCPNDTFIFDALVHHRIDTGQYRFIPLLEDVETLNLWAMQHRWPVTKLSYHGYLQMTDQYIMSRAGGALGFGVGPLLITKNVQGFSTRLNPLILLPGEHTTAHLLFKLAYPALKNKQFVPFHEIENKLLAGQADAGVIIHENRFTYADKGLQLIQDLGEWWDQETGLPIPLGGVAISRSLPPLVRADIARLIRASIVYGFQHPEESKSFIQSHAQEMEESVRQKHIQLYVNEYSVDLGDLGIKAVKELATRLSNHHESMLNFDNLFI